MIEITKPPQNLIACRNAHLQYLCDRMRPDEIEQYVALTHADSYDPEVAARGFMNTPGVKFTIVSRCGMPAAAGGYQEVMPGIWQSWMVGSVEGWAECWRSITKGSRWVMDGLFQMGARRLQTNALLSRTAAIEWYEQGLGLQREGVMRGMGRGGEDVVLYAAVRLPQSSVIEMRGAA